MDSNGMGCNGKTPGELNRMNLISKNNLIQHFYPFFVMYLGVHNVKEVYKTFVLTIGKILAK